MTSRFVVWRDPTDHVVPVEPSDPPRGDIVREWRAVPAEGQAGRLGPWLVDVPY